MHGVMTSRGGGWYWSKKCIFGAFRVGDDYKIGYALELIAI